MSKNNDEEAKFVMAFSFTYIGMLVLLVVMLSIMSGCTIPRMDTNPLSFNYPEEQATDTSTKQWAGKYDTVPKNAFDHKDYSTTSLDKNKLLSMLNNYRKQNGLYAVSLDNRLNKAALRHAKDLAKHDRISHHGSDGSEPDKRISDAGYSYRFAAENVATGQSSLAEAFKGWQESPGHNANLLSSEAKHIGIALVVDKKTGYKTFWVMTFAA